MAEPIIANLAQLPAPLPARRAGLTRRRV